MISSGCIDTRSPLDSRFGSVTQKHRQYINRHKLCEKLEYVGEETARRMKEKTARGIKIDRRRRSQTLDSHVTVPNSKKTFVV